MPSARLAWAWAYRPRPTRGCSGRHGERQLVALALPGGFPDYRVQQALGLLSLAPPGREEQRADAPVPPAGLLDRDPLVEAPFRLIQQAGQQLGYSRVAERE